MSFGENNFEKQDSTPLVINVRNLRKFYLTYSFAHMHVRFCLDVLRSNIYQLVQIIFQYGGV